MPSKPEADRRLRTREHEREQSVGHRAVRLVEVMESPSGSPTRSGSPSRSESRSGSRSGSRAANRSEARAPEWDRVCGMAVESIVPEGDGEVIAVSLTVPDPDGARMLRRRVRITVEQYAELRLTVGAMDEAQYTSILAAGELCEAVRQGMALLGYGDLSVRRLAYKLVMRGHERSVSEEAARYLADRGYLRENESACRRAEQGVRKLWGRRRIAEDLRAHGYSDETVSAALETLEDVDFEDMCARVIRKKHRGVPSDRDARRKLTAALLRLGYSSDEVRHALATVYAEAAED